MEKSARVRKSARRKKSPPPVPLVIQDYRAAMRRIRLLKLSYPSPNRILVNF